MLRITLFFNFSFFTILKYASLRSLGCLMNGKVKYLQVFEVQFFGLDTGPQSFCYSFIALSIIPCSKSARNSLFRFQFHIVAMETTQLVLSH